VRRPVRIVKVREILPPMSRAEALRLDKHRRAERFASQVEFGRAAFHPARIAVLGTISGDAVYLTPLASSDSDLVALARRLTDDSAPPGGRFGGVVFPMVDLMVSQNLDVAVGLMTRAADTRPVTREAWRNPGDLASRLSRPGAPTST
jgi:hypothetical protein